MRSSLTSILATIIMGILIFLGAIVEMPRIFGGSSTKFRAAQVACALSGILITIGPILELLNIPRPIPVVLSLVGLGLFPVSVVVLVVTNIG